jgi:isopentenyl-diphosphate delta-isomerase
LTEVILVNESDVQIGTIEKMEAHRKALLHRAFSVFIFNQHGEMLLQKRAANKYHSPLLWTNACCSHPMPGEATIDAAHRRLIEELGFDTELTHAFHFIYQTAFDNGLTEHELDHVFIGYYDGTIHPNAHEVDVHQFFTIPQIEVELTSNADQYTSWFKIAFPELLKYLAKATT